MREILFRGQKINSKKWVKGNLYSYISILGIKRYFILNSSYIERNSLYFSLQFEVIPESVGQYIGLSDKNGKKTFNNDICKYHYVIFASMDPEVLPIEYNGIGIIVFQEGTFWIRDKDKTIPLYYQELSFEIIGNIIDNPELIK